MSDASPIQTTTVASNPRSGVAASSSITADLSSSSASAALPFGTDASRDRETVGGASFDALLGYTTSSYTHINKSQRNWPADPLALNAGGRADMTAIFRFLSDQGQKTDELTALIVDAEDYAEQVKRNRQNPFEDPEYWRKWKAAADGYAAMIDAALDKFPPLDPSVAAVNRGLELPDDVLDTIQAGGTYTDKAFLSTSAKAPLGGKNCVMVMNVGACRNGRKLGHASKYPAEEEVLFKQGQTYRYVAIYRKSRDWAQFCVYGLQRAAYLFETSATTGEVVLKSEYARVEAIVECDLL